MTRGVGRAPVGANGVAFVLAVLSTWAFLGTFVTIALAVAGPSEVDARHGRSAPGEARPPAGYRIVVASTSPVTASAASLCRSAVCADTITSHAATSSSAPTASPIPRHIAVARTCRASMVS